MYQKNIRVVIIDSGLDIEDDELRNCIEEQIEINLNQYGQVIKRKGSIVKNKHGTIIAKTILNITENIEFIDVNILDENLGSNGKILIEALNYSLRYKPNIIHLSLGTTKLKYWYPLRKVINKLIKNNIIIVAATNNEGKRCYPAYLKNVFGVRGNSLKNYKMFYYKDNFFYAPYDLSPELLASEKMKNVKGTSISAAYITGHICNILKNNYLIDREKIIKNIIAIGEENYFMIDKK